jgi:hypothetical protein
MALVLKQTRSNSNDYDVVSGEVKLGRIVLVELFGGRKLWRWSIQAIRPPADQIYFSGDANTLDEARAAFGANIKRFLGMARWAEIEPPDPFDEVPGG